VLELLRKEAEAKDQQVGRSKTTMRSVSLEER
jgi:hypothetical protein